MSPLVSVIVPVYNGQEYLEKCIESISKQTYDNLEILIVNDGSTDDTVSVCNRLADKYKINNEYRILNVYIINQKKQGVSAARNTGIQNANGEYITFVDVDDRVLSNMIQVLYNDMLKTESDVAGCSFIHWSKEEEWREREANESILDKKCTSYSSKQFAELITNYNTRCWSKLYKRRCFIDTNVRFATDLTIGEDMLLLADLTKKEIKFCESEYIGYGYYHNNTGAMNRVFSVKAMDQIYCWERARQILGVSGKIDSIIIISVLLTVGRIAALCREERARYEREIKIAHETLIKYYNKDSVFCLDNGYKIKAVIFKLMPKLYIGLYNVWKR